ncbi:MAG: hypothetical protein ABFS86_18820 [Planctomycetota bacterium]
MRCRDARRLLVTEEIPGYGLPPRGTLRRHLDRCEVCREEARRLRSEAALIRIAFHDLPVRDGFTEDVLARLAREEDQTPIP